MEVLHSPKYEAPEDPHVVRKPALLRGLLSGWLLGSATKLGRSTLDLQAQRPDSRMPLQGYKKISSIRLARLHTLDSSDAQTYQATPSVLAAQHVRCSRLPATTWDHTAAGLTQTPLPKWQTQKQPLRPLPGDM